MLTCSGWDVAPHLAKYFDDLYCNCTINKSLSPVKARLHNTESRRHYQQHEQSS